MEKSIGRLFIESLFVIMLIGVMALLIFSLSIVTVKYCRMVWTWPAASALIISVKPDGASKGGYNFHLRLAAAQGRGEVVTGDTIYPVVRSRSWSRPFQPPLPGERLEVRFDPHDPTRMIAVEKLRERWLGLALLPLFALTALFLAKQVIDRFSTLKQRLWQKRDHA